MICRIQFKLFRIISININIRNYTKIAPPFPSEQHAKTEKQDGLNWAVRQQQNFSSIEYSE